MSETERSDTTEPHLVEIVVESEDNKKFHIATADLERIAAQLRAKRTFSVFNSVILPIGVTVLTAILTAMVAQTFQYVSWRNSTALQEATDHVTRATAAYDRATNAIEERHYATYLFLFAIRDLINRKQEVDSQLYRLDRQLSNRRFDDYFAQLKRWNETNGLLVGEIDFALDQPIGIAERKRGQVIEKIDCKLSLPEQLQAHDLNPNSLKLQFTAITSCFARGIKEFSKAKDQGVVDNAFMLDEAIRAGAEDALSHVMSMANEFRCYALSRIEFLKSRQGRAIYRPPFIGWLRGSNENREARDKKAHFQKTTEKCRFY
jgi:hypothetical protein